jgi:hypothetical protein
MHATTKMDEWIQTALVEYEEIASLCNAQSLLGNTAAATSNAPRDLDDEISADDYGTYIDPKTLTMQLQRKRLLDELSGYYHAIDVVRRTHASLKEQLSKMYDNNIGTKTFDNDGNNEGPIISRRGRMASPVVVNAFSRHIELSERVIRTVMMQSSSYANNSGPCGILFEDGIIRTSSSSASGQDVNVVALSSLRASVSQLKVYFNRGDAL